MTAPAHIPVLLAEVVEALAPAPGEHHVDGTFGAGGYSRALLSAGASVTAFDRDPDAVVNGRALEASSAGKLRLVEGRYAELEASLEDKVDGVTFDIGLSSMQLDRPGRGFSYSDEGPLDMRMERAGESAADLVNGAEEEALADIIFRYGDEPRSRRIARAIVQARPLETTTALAAVARKAVGHHPGRKKDPAARVFQAIRIHLNRELGELEDGLAAAERVLKPGGRLAVVTFHSLEDRIVKRFLKERGGARPAVSRHLPGEREGPPPSFERVARPVRPSEIELAANSRARSATLRSAVRTSAPSFSPGVR